MNIVYTHTNINTPDWRKLSAFYEKVFNMVLVPPLRDLHGTWYQQATGMKNAHVTGCHMRLPGYGDSGPTIEFFTWDYPDGTSANQINGGGMGHLAFAVDNVEEKVSEILSAGGSTYGRIVKSYYPSKNQTLTICYAKDPDGNCLEIQRWDDGDMTEIDS